MKIYFLLYVLVTAAAGCAQNQMVGSRASQPTTKNFDACGLSVRFSGEPTVMPDTMANLFVDEYGKNGPEGQGWLYIASFKGERKVENAFCVCPGEPKLSEIRTTLTDKSGFGKFVDGVGYRFELPVTETEKGSKFITSTTMVNSTSNCVVVQTFAGSGTPENLSAAAAPFLSSLTLIPKEPIKSEVNPTSKSAAERLRQLDQLLSEKLITREEFDTQRKAIVKTL